LKADGCFIPKEEDSTRIPLANSGLYPCSTLKERFSLQSSQEGTASDWKLEVDLKSQIKFPQEITVINLRSDIVMWSLPTKQIALVELTVPWEERIEESFERKLTKYQTLTESCVKRGWKAWCFPVEVDCRGFPAQSLRRTFSQLGITS